nr:alpha-tectorin [Oryctolagus cuniculus]
MELLWLLLVAAWAWGSALGWAAGGGSQPVPGAVPSTLQNRVTWSEETRASLLYPYGREHGDQVLPAKDDGFSEELPLLEPFTLFGVPHRTAYVCTNGLVSFGEPVALFTPEAFPLETGQAFVAPFWADGSTSSGGHVWYRQSRRPELLRRAAGDLAAAFPHGPHSPRALLVATWDQIPFYGSLGSQVNTFQLVLVMGSGTSWALFLYNDIQWTTGVASGGSPHSGLGGIAAQAGFNSGRQGHYFSVPGSRTADILHVAGTSNVGVPGRWAFRTDAFAVPNGCAYSGQFLPLGATFWDSSACSHRCHCGQEGRVRCWPEGCQGGQQCAPAHPFARCHAPRGPTCRLGAQGHLHTLSGRQLRLRPCRFVLARLPGVRVDVELAGEAPEPAVLVQLLVHGQDLVVRSDGPPGHVLVNGHLRPLPLSVPEAGLAVHSWDSATRLAMDTGLELWIQDGRLELTVPEAEVSVTRGLCGPEALTPVGTPQLEPASFQASWQEAGPCGSPWPSCPVHLRARYAGPEACGRLSALTGPFAACAWTVPVGPFVDACVEELCAAHGSLPVLCRALAAFVRTCQAMDIPVGTWRGPGFCEPSCPENSHWETCADTCGARCPHEDEALACGGPCREGCVCDAGHLRSGGTCVHPAACGCPWQGRVLPLGAQELSPDCRELCQCREAGRPPHCRPQACAAGTACLLRAGAWHCEARRGSSWVSGDPHYRTFDGAAFTAQGACRYVLSRTCRALPGAPAFVVWVDNEYLSPAASVTGARQIEVDVHGVKVVMEALTPGRVQVNGTLAHLPLHLAGGLVHVYFSGTGAVLQTSAGLLVSYDWRRHVSIMVP